MDGARGAQNRESDMYNILFGELMKKKNLYDRDAHGRIISK
jgi:hypothetical protein